MLYAVAMLDYAGEDTTKLWLSVAEMHRTADESELLLKPWETKVRLYDDVSKRLFDRELTGLKSIVYYRAVNPLKIDKPYFMVEDSIIAELQAVVPLAKEVLNIENFLKLDGKGGALFLYEKKYCNTNAMTGLKLTNTLKTGGLSDVVIQDSKVLHPFQIIQDGESYSLRVVNILTGEEQVTQDTSECIENDVYVVYQALLDGITIDSMVVSRGFSVMSSYFVTEVNKGLCKYDYERVSYGTGRELVARCISEAPLYNVQSNTSHYLSLVKIGGKVGIRLGLSSRRLWDTSGAIVTAKDGVLIPFKNVGDKQVLAIDVMSNKRACGVLIDRTAWNLETWVDKGFRMVDGNIFSKGEADSTETCGIAEYSDALALFGLKRSSVTVGERGFLTSVSVINDMIDLRGVPGLRLQNKCLNIGAVAGKHGHWLLVDKNLTSVSGTELLSITTNRLNIVIESEVDPDVLFVLIKSLTAQVHALHVYINLKAMTLIEIATLVYSCITLIADINIHCFIADTHGNFECDRRYKHGEKRGALDFIENSFDLGNRESATKTVNYQYHILGKSTLCSQIMELGIVLGVLLQFEKSTTKIAVKLEKANLIFKGLEFTSMESLLVSSLSERSLAVNDKGEVINCKYPRSKESFYSLYKLLNSAVYYTTALADKVADAQYTDLRHGTLLILVDRLSNLLKGLSGVPINFKSASDDKFNVSCADLLGIRVNNDAELNKLHELQQYLYTIIQKGEEIC